MPADEAPHDSIDSVDSVDSPDEDDATDDGRRRLSFWAELPLLVGLALVIAVVVKTFFFQAFFIPSGSMRDTLQVDDRVLVNKLSYQFGEINRGQIIVFDRDEGSDEGFVEALFRNLAESIGLRTPESDLIKRVVALPGETVEIVDNQVIIDGVVLSEPYLRSTGQMQDFSARRMKSDEYFVMGDNRASSRDSRIDGPVLRDQIIGRAFVVVWPPSRWGGL